MWGLLACEPLSSSHCPVQRQSLSETRLVEAAEIFAKIAVFAMQLSRDIDLSIDDRLSGDCWALITTLKEKKLSGKSHSGSACCSLACQQMAECCFGHIWLRVCMAQLYAHKHSPA